MSERRHPLHGLDRRAGYLPGAAREVKGTENPCCADPRAHLYNQQPRTMRPTLSMQSARAAVHGPRTQRVQTRSQPARALAFQLSEPRYVHGTAQSFRLFEDTNRDLSVSWEFRYTFYDDFGVHVYKSIAEYDALLGNARFTSFRVSDRIDDTLYGVFTGV
jgi:hypothetical protein